MGSFASPTKVSSRIRVTIICGLGREAQLGIVGNLSDQFAPSAASLLRELYTHSGRDQGRLFQDENCSNARKYRNFRLQFIEMA